MTIFLDTRNIDEGKKYMNILGVIRGVTTNPTAMAGADIVTVVPKLIEGMIVHPYSKDTVQMFLRDAAKTEKMLK